MVEVTPGFETISPVSLFFSNDAGTKFEQVASTNPLPMTPSGQSFANITTATTTLVKSGQTTLNSIVINTPVANATVTIYNSLTAMGTKVGTITLPATLVSDGPIAVPYNVSLSIGLTVVTTGTQDITVTFR